MKEHLRKTVSEALKTMGVSGDITPTFEKPRIASHGDLTTNVAMVAAKSAGMNPRQLAAGIAAAVSQSDPLIESVEVAGPGFINFRFSAVYYHRRLRDIVAAGKEFGRSFSGKGIEAQVEFVSANPTGPLTVGHGRGAVYGDTVARLLEWTGHRVTREYYFNNAGRQMRILGDSVRLRYLELLGEGAPFPEDYYQGEYIRDIAKRLFEKEGDRLRDEPAEGAFKRQAENDIFADIKGTLRRLGIAHDVFYNENSLYESGKVEATLSDLRAKGVLYDQDGAVWLRLTALGGEKDKVVVKNTGEPTYRLPDIAYHREKYRRGFGLIIDVLGADHVATYPDVVAALKALGYDTNLMKVLIHQFVTIVRDGEVVKMSTRKANYVTLDELMDEATPDVVRYFFLMRGIGNHLNFDLKLAREQSDTNPVFYLQYAHARIASIIRHAESLGIDFGEADLSVLPAPEETGLMKALAAFPDTVESCAQTYEPHRLIEYLHDTAGAFHRFYHARRVVTEDMKITAARMTLALATKIVIGNGCSLLGITAPEKM
ncbi:MAG TPA: arginine--tRNA ligase [Bacteroidota bacterium]|nr:arginine--tRNA ligase [Bacteroidota bacterium]